MRNRKQCPLTWKDGRRLRAFDLKLSGWPQRAIAEAFGVSEAAVSQWCKTGLQKGRKGLYGCHRPGAPAKLSDEQRRLIPDLLWHGAEAYGFRGEMWTCARVGKMIEQEFGVSYHPDHVCRILRELGWTPQKPILRADQRDEAQIRYWRDVKWPLIKKKPVAKGVR